MRTFLILLLAPCSLLAQADFTLLAGESSVSAGGGGGSPTYIIKQGFEGAGYDNGETWTEVTPGTLNEDYTTTVLDGSQSLSISGGNSATMDHTSFASQNEAWAYCLFRYSSDGSAISSILAFRDSTLTALAICRLSATSGVTLYTDGADSAASATTLSTDTTYNIWLHYLRNGTCELFISTSSTRPSADGGGNVYLTKTAADIAATRISMGANSSAAGIWDKVRVDDAEIGNAPE